METDECDRKNLKNAHDELPTFNQHFLLPGVDLLGDLARVRRGRTDFYESLHHLRDFEHLPTERLLCGRQLLLAAAVNNHQTAQPTGRNFGEAKEAAGV